MEDFKMPRVPVVKTVIGIIIALVIGTIFPVALTFQLTLLMPMILLSNLLMPVLFVSGGMPAVAALIIAELASTIFFFGETIGMMVLAAAVFPGVSVILGMRRRAHFFDQLRTGIVVHVIGFIVAIAIAYFSFGGDMIRKFIDGVRQQFASLPDEIIMPTVESVNQMVAAMMGGTVSPENMVTVDTYRSMVTGTMLDVMQEMYVEYIPGCLLIGAVLTGLISVLWGNWRMARRGLATAESFIGMSKWNLPTHVSGGVFFIWIVGAMIIATGSYSSATTAYRAIYMLVQVAFYIQAIACFDRMLIGRYMGLRGRRILIFLVLIGAMIIPLINVIMFVWGGGSAFMGIVRSVRSGFNRNDDNNENHDDSDNIQ